MNGKQMPGRRERVREAKERRWNDKKHRLEKVYHKRQKINRKGDKARGRNKQRNKKQGTVS